MKKRSRIGEEKVCTQYKSTLLTNSCYRPICPAKSVRQTFCVTRNKSPLSQTLMLLSNHFVKFIRLGALEQDLRFIGLNARGSEGIW